MLKQVLFMCMPSLVSGSVPKPIEKAALSQLYLIRVLSALLLIDYLVVQSQIFELCFLYQPMLSRSDASTTQEKMGEGKK